MKTYCRCHCTLTAVLLFTQICAVVWGAAVREVPESVRVLDNAVQEPGRLGQGLQKMGPQIPQVVDMITYVCGRTGRDCIRMIGSP